MANGRIRGYSASYEQTRRILESVFHEGCAKVIFDGVRESVRGENGRGKRDAGRAVYSADGERISSSTGEERFSINSASQEQDATKFSLVNTSKVENTLNQDKNLSLPEDVKFDTKAVQLYAKDAMRAAKNSQGKINQQVKMVAGKILKETASRYKRSDLESNLRAVVEEYAKNGPSAEVARQITGRSKENSADGCRDYRSRPDTIRKDLMPFGVSGLFGI